MSIKKIIMTITIINFLSNVFSQVLLSNDFSQVVLSNAEDAVKIGLSNSDDIHELENSAILQMRNAKISITPFLPELGFSWNEVDKVPVYARDSRNKTIDLTVRQLLFDNGKSSLSYLVNRHMAYLSYLDCQKKNSEKSIEIIEAFYNLILQDKIIELKTDLIINTEKELAVIEYKYNSGLAVKSDYLEFQISCKELSNEILKLNQKRSLLCTKLKNLLNIPQLTEIKLPETIPALEYSIQKLSPLQNQYETKILENSIELKKSEAEYNYQKKQYNISKRIFLPNISLEADIAFSGQSYPLTQPDYSIKLFFSFDDLPFFKPGFSNGYTFNDKRLSALSNSTSTKLTPEINFFTARKLTKSSLRQAELLLQETRIQLQTQIFELISEHDNLIDYISLLEESIEIQKEKLKISEYEFKAGLLKATDYIKEKNNLSESIQKLFQSQIQLVTLQKKIELITN